MARNTTVIRSNYLYDESAGDLRTFAQALGRAGSRLDYDVLFSQRGLVGLAHTLSDIREGRRRINANRLNGVDAEWLTPEDG